MASASELDSGSGEGAGSASTSGAETVASSATGGSRTGGKVGSGSFSACAMAASAAGGGTGLDTRSAGSDSTAGVEAASAGGCSSTAASAGVGRLRIDRLLSLRAQHDLELRELLLLRRIWSLGRGTRGRGRRGCIFVLEFGAPRRELLRHRTRLRVAEHHRPRARARHARFHFAAAAAATTRTRVRKWRRPLCTRCLLVVQREYAVVLRAQLRRVVSEAPRNVTLARGLFFCCVTGYDEELCGDEVEAGGERKEAGVERRLGLSLLERLAVVEVCMRENAPEPPGERGEVTVRRLWDLKATIV